MTTSNLILLAATIGALFGGSVVVCWQYRRAATVVDNAPVPTEEQIQVRHDLNAQTMAHILSDDLDVPDWVNAGRRELAADPLAHQAANVVPGPWGPRVVPGQREASE